MWTFAKFLGSSTEQADPSASGECNERRCITIVRDLLQLDAQEAEHFGVGALKSGCREAAPRRLGDLVWPGRLPIFETDLVFSNGHGRALSSEVNRARRQHCDSAMQLANMLRKEPFARVRSNSDAFPSSGKLSALALGGRLTSIQSLQVPRSGTTLRGNQSQHCRVICQGSG